jgi:hypothetical protein
MLGFVFRLAFEAGGRPFGFFFGGSFMAVAGFARALGKLIPQVKGILKGKKMGSFTFFFSSPF